MELFHQEEAWRTDRTLQDHPCLGRSLVTFLLITAVTARDKVLPVSLPTPRAGLDMVDSGCSVLAVVVLTLEVVSCQNISNTTILQLHIRHSFGVGEDDHAQVLEHLEIEVIRPDVDSIPGLRIEDVCSASHNRLDCASNSNFVHWHVVLVQGNYASLYHLNHLLYSNRVLISGGNWLGNFYFGQFQCLLEGLDRASKFAGSRVV
jgi:hypothetical protein